MAERSFAKEVGMLRLGEGGKLFLHSLGEGGTEGRRWLNDPLRKKLSCFAWARAGRRGAGG